MTPNPPNLAAQVWRDCSAVREQTPLVQNISNFVTMAFNANTLLAFGASPIMSHANEEAAEIAGLVNAVVVNMGTLDSHWVPSMQTALTLAHQAGKPSVFDPVGAGASAYRNRVAADLMQRHPTIVRGNASEILSLAGCTAHTKGVDSADAVEVALEAAHTLAKQHACVVCVSGANDHIVAPGGKCAILSNGDVMMTQVTGTGCSASALIGAFAAVQPDPWQACVSAMGSWGVVGQLATARQAHGAGLGAYATALLDVASTLTQDELTATLRVTVTS